MSIVVVGGNGRGMGKTALVCGVISALPEFSWAAVKITTESHAGLSRVYEEPAAEELAADESASGQGSDTARYLAAGARRAFLVAAADGDFGERIGEWIRELRKLLGPDLNVIFESNRILRFLEPDLCLAIEPEADAPRKPSFALVERLSHARVRRTESNGEDFCPQVRPIFSLADFAYISPPMQHWLRERLRPHAGMPAQVAERTNCQG